MTFELGHVPERDEEVIIDSFVFKIISANSRRINTMQVSLVSDAELKKDSSKGEGGKTNSKKTASDNAA